MKIISCVVAALLVGVAGAQEGATLKTQVLVREEAKAEVTLTPDVVSLEVDGKKTPVMALTAVAPGNAQVALLIDDGLSRSSGTQLEDLRAFAKGLPANVEVLVGYMTHGSVEVEQGFTTDHAAAAEKIRLPSGLAGTSGSPYFCLSDFAKKWPGGDEDGPGLRKARFVLMITNGVDLYNGSVSITNQDSPYVATAVEDAERAGIQVSSIYYSDAGLRGGAAALSGQGYLKQVSDATGGEAYYQGSFNPVAFKPFLGKFTRQIAETYVATFNVGSSGGREHLLRLKMSSSVPKLKLRHPSEVRPGNKEVAE